LVDCYFNIKQPLINYFIQNNINYIIGLYKKIDGDDYQPETVDITDDGNYVYRNNLGTRINVGNFTNNSNIPGYITTHYNNEGNVISRSTVISREFIDYGTTIIKTIGESFLTGKFGNPNYIGKYYAIHKYVYYGSEVIYNNDYYFIETNLHSFATYKLKLDI